MSYKKQAIKDLCEVIKSNGYRVFLAESERYGFFTDKEGTKVISFEIDILSISFGGKYKTNNPKKTGNGWKITEQYEVNKKDLECMFNAKPPQWAIGASKWRFTTLEQHLEAYQRSSNYKEI